MRSPVTSVVLGGTLVAVSALAACGGPSVDPKDPRASSSAPKGDPTPPAPVTPGTSSAGTGTSVPGTPPSQGAMKAPGPSAMAEDLKKVGLDPKALPPLNKLSREQLTAVMNSFKKALGTQCTGCHDGGNFKAATPKKKIATKMWDQFARGLTLEDGSLLYCDSCHNGQMEFLDRHDKKALGAWMDTNFVGKMKRVDKKDHSCETCHGDPFEPKFLAAWSK